jgi:hypothetical protein
MHMNMYLFFKNLNILCIFSDRFFDPVFFRFRFLGSTGSMTGSVLVTLLYSIACYAYKLEAATNVYGEF